MHDLRDPALARLVADPEVRKLVELRFAQVFAGEEYDPDLHGYMIVVEPGDRAEELESESGCALLHDVLGEARFGDPDFAPAAEAIEEHASCYELLFVLNDDGYGIEIFVPKAEGVDPELLAMCAQFAVPAREVARPQ
jgi:hypothetical protein